MMNTDVQEDAGKKELKGVGGWLAFLIFSLGILSPLRTLYEYGRDILPSLREYSVAGEGIWNIFLVISVLLIVISIVLFVTAAWCLLQRHVWRSVRYAIFAMWMACVGLDIIGMGVFYVIFGQAFVVAMVLELNWEIFQSVVYPTVWTIYLLLSRRVKNTYRRDTGVEELAKHMGVKM